MLENANHTQIKLGRPSRVGWWISSGGGVSGQVGSSGSRGRRRRFRGARRGRFRHGGFLRHGCPSSSRFRCCRIIVEKCISNDSTRVVLAWIVLLPVDFIEFRTHLSAEAVSGSACQRAKSPYYVTQLGGVVRKLVRPHEEDGNDPDQQEFFNRQSKHTLRVTRPTWKEVRSDKVLGLTLDPPVHIRPPWTGSRAEPPERGRRRRTSRLYSRSLFSPSPANLGQDG